MRMCSCDMNIDQTLLCFLLLHAKYCKIYWLSKLRCSCACVCVCLCCVARRMDQREGSRKRARGEEEEGKDSPPVKMTALAAAAAADALAEAAFQAAAPAVVEGGDGDGDAWKPPPGLFDFPWLSCRGGLGAHAISPVVELRDVFFRSQVDGHTAAVGVPGDRFIAPPSNMMLFVVLAEWVATAGEGEVDPMWRSVLGGDNPAA